MADNPTNPMLGKELVTAQMFQKFVNKFSADTKMTRKHEKEKAEEARAEVKKTNDELKSLNERIKKGEEVRSKEYEDAVKRAEEMRTAQVQTNINFGNFSEEADKLREDNKEQLAKLDDIVAGQSDVLNAEEMQGRRQDATARRDKAQELSDEEKRKDQGFASKKMVGLLSGIEKGIGGMWKKGKGAVGLTFKGALIATGLLLLMRFLESKKWQEIKASIKKFADEGGFDFIKTALSGIYDWLFGENSVFKRIGKVFDAFFGEEEREGPAGQYVKKEGGSFMKGIKELYKQFGEWPLWIAAFAVMAILPLKLQALVLVGSVMWWGAKGIWTAFTALGGWVVGLGQRIFKGIGTFLKEKWATSPIKTAFEGIGKKFTSIVTKFKDILSRTIEGAGKWLKELGKKVGNAVPTRFLTSVPDYIKGASRAAGSALRTGGAATAKVLGGAYKHSKSIGTKMAGFGKSSAYKLAEWGSGSWKKIATEAAKKAPGLTKVGKAISGSAKFALKKVPGVSILVGTGLAALALSEGKYARAAGEMLSGILASVPPIGTAASLALDAAMMSADSTMEEKQKALMGRLQGMARNKESATLGFGKNVVTAGLHQKYLAQKKEAAVIAETERMGGTGISFEEFRNQNRGIRGTSMRNQLAMWQAELGREGYKGVAPQAFIHGGDDNSQSFSVMPVGSAANEDKYLAHEWMSGP